MLKYLQHFIQTVNISLVLLYSSKRFIFISPSDSFFKPLVYKSIILSFDYGDLKMMSYLEPAPSKIPQFLKEFRSVKGNVVLIDFPSGFKLHCIGLSPKSVLSCLFSVILKQPQFLCLWCKRKNLVLPWNIWKRRWRNRRQFGKGETR